MLWKIMKERYISMSDTRKEVKKEVKKTSTKKAPAKTKTVKKVAKPSAKKVEKKVTTKKDNKKKRLSSENILLMVFLLLLIVVIVLTIMVFNRRNEFKKEPNANLVIPVFKVGEVNNVSLNITSLVKDGEYILKIANYKNGKINQEEFNYSLTIENESNAIIEVTKDSDAKNLMGNEKAIKVEEQVLSKDKKDEDYYHIRVVSDDGVKDSDKLNIRVES